jgi:hypothetical protein
MDNLMIYIGLLCLILPGTLWLLYMVWFRLRSHQTVGVIVDYKTHGGENGSYQVPVVEFQLPDGQTIAFTEKMSSNDSGLLALVGELFSHFVLKQSSENVPVIYNPNKPQQARINRFSNLYLMPVILILVGGGMIVFTFPQARAFIQPLLNLIYKIPDWLQYLL